MMEPIVFATRLKGLSSIHLICVLFAQILSLTVTTASTILIVKLVNLVSILKVMGHALLVIPLAITALSQAQSA